MAIPKLYDQERDRSTDFDDQFRSPIFGPVELGQSVCWEDEKGGMFCLGFVQSLPSGQTFARVVEVITVHPVLGESMGAKGVPHVVHVVDLFRCSEEYDTLIQREKVDIHNGFVA